MNILKTDSSSVYYVAKNEGTNQSVEAVSKVAVQKMPVSQTGFSQATLLARILKNSSSIAKSLAVFAENFRCCLLPDLRQV